MNLSDKIKNASKYLLGVIVLYLVVWVVFYRVESSMDAEVVGFGKYYDINSPGFRSFTNNYSYGQKYMLDVAFRPLNRIWVHLRFDKDKYKFEDSE